MNPETQKLLETLAVRLGTTVEHLWAVLLYQARISFWSDIIYYLVTIILIYPTTKLAIFLYKESSQWEEDGKTIFWRIVSIALVVFNVSLLLNLLFSIEDTATKFMNPEYWALLQILRYIK